MLYVWMYAAVCVVMAQPSLCHARPGSPKCLSRHSQGRSWHWHGNYLISLKTVLLIVPLLYVHFTPRWNYLNTHVSPISENSFDTSLASQPYSLRFNAGTTITSTGSIRGMIPSPNSFSSSTKKGVFLQHPSSTNSRPTPNEMVPHL